MKGWRKLCPSRSRLAFPLPVWCGISRRMVARVFLGMATFNLLQVSSYHRPGALLKLRRLGLVRPTSRITGHWCLVTSLTDTSDTSKTGTKDGSILPKMERVWSYSQYLSVFHSCCQDLGVELVPYQARHSGPSIDRAMNVRTQEKVRKEEDGWGGRAWHDTRRRVISLQLGESSAQTHSSAAPWRKSASRRSCSAATIRS